DRGRDVRLLRTLPHRGCAPRSGIPPCADHEPIPAHPGPGGYSERCRAPAVTCIVRPTCARTRATTMAVMEPTTLGFLGLLALADSTSFGTLLIPIWLLLATGRPRPGRMLVYLGTVAAFYFLVGLLLSVGAGLFLDDIQRWLETGSGAVAIAVAGGGLVALAFWMDKRRKSAEQAGGGRLMRWRERVMSAETGSARPLAALALTATVIEVATLLPYLIAIGVM